MYSLDAVEKVLESLQRPADEQAGDAPPQLNGGEGNNKVSPLSFPSTRLTAHIDAPCKLPLALAGQRLEPERADVSSAAPPALISDISLELLEARLEVSGAMSEGPRRHEGKGGRSNNHDNGLCTIGLSWRLSTCTRAEAPSKDDASKAGESDDAPKGISDGKSGIRATSSTLINGLVSASFPSRSSSSEQTRNDVDSPIALGDHGERHDEDEAPVEKQKESRSTFNMPKSMQRLMQMSQRSNASGGEAGDEANRMGRAEAFWDLSVKPSTIPAQYQQQQQQQQRDEVERLRTSGGNRSPSAAANGQSLPPTCRAPSPTSSSRQRSQTPPSDGGPMLPPMSASMKAFELFLVCVHPASWLMHGNDTQQQSRDVPGYAKPRSTPPSTSSGVGRQSGGVQHVGKDRRLTPIAGGEGTADALYPAMNGAVPMAGDAAPTPEPVTATAFRCTILVTLAADGRIETTTTRADESDSSLPSSSYFRHVSQMDDVLPHPVVVSAHFARLWTRCSFHGTHTSNKADTCPAAEISPTASSSWWSGDGGGSFGGSYNSNPQGQMKMDIGANKSTTTTAGEFSDGHTTSHLLYPPSRLKMLEMLRGAHATRVRKPSSSSSSSSSLSNRRSQQGNVGQEDAFGEGETTAAEPSLPPAEDDTHPRSDFERIPNPRYKGSVAREADGGFGFARLTKSAGARATSASVRNKDEVNTYRFNRDADFAPPTDKNKGRLNASAGHSNGQRRREWAFERPAPGTHVWTPILNTVVTPSLLQSRKKEHEASPETQPPPLYRSEACRYRVSFRVLTCRPCPIPAFSHISLQLMVAGVWEVEQTIEVIKEVRRAEGEGVSAAGGGEEPPKIPIKTSLYSKKAQQLVVASITLMRRVTTEASAGAEEGDGYSDGSQIEGTHLSGGVLKDGSGAAARPKSPLAAAQGRNSPMRPSTPLSNSMALPRPSSASNIGPPMIPPLSASLLAPPAPRQPKPLTRTQRVAVMFNVVPTNHDEALAHAIAHTIIPTELFLGARRKDEGADAEEGHDSSPIAKTVELLAANRALLYEITAAKASAFFLQRKLAHMWQVNSGVPPKAGGGGSVSPAYILEARPTGASESHHSVGATRTPPFLARLKSASSSEGNAVDHHRQHHAPSASTSTYDAVANLPSASALRSGAISAIPREAIEGYRHNDFCPAPPSGGVDDSLPPKPAPQGPSHPQTKGVYSFHSSGAVVQSSHLLSSTLHSIPMTEAGVEDGVHIPTPFAASAVKAQTASAAAPLPSTRVAAACFDFTTGTLFTVFHAESPLELSPALLSGSPSRQRRSSSSTHRHAAAGGEGKGEGDRAEGKRTTTKASRAKAYFIFACSTTALASSLAAPARRSHLTFSASFVGYVPANMSSSGSNGGQRQNGNALWHEGGGQESKEKSEKERPFVVLNAAIIVPSHASASKVLLGGSGDVSGSPFVGSERETGRQFLSFHDDRDGASMAVCLPPPSATLGASREPSAVSSRHRTSSVERGVNDPDLGLWSTRAQNDDQKKHTLATRQHNYLLTSIIVGADGNGGVREKDCDRSDAEQDNNTKTPDASPIRSSDVRREEGEEEEVIGRGNADSAEENNTPIQRNRKDEVCNADTSAKEGAEGEASAIKSRGRSPSTQKTTSRPHSPSFASSSSSPPPPPHSSSPHSSVDALRKAIVQEYLLCNASEEKVVKAKSALRHHIAALVSSYTEDDYVREGGGGAKKVSAADKKEESSSDAMQSRGGDADDSKASAVDHRPREGHEKKAVIFTYSIRSRKEIKTSLAKYAALDEQHSKINAYQHVLLEQLLKFNGGGSTSGGAHGGGGDEHGSDFELSSSSAAPTPTKGRLKTLPPRESTTTTTTIVDQRRRRASSSVSLHSAKAMHQQAGAVALWEGRAKRHAQLQRALSPKRDAPKKKGTTLPHHEHHQPTNPTHYQPTNPSHYAADDGDDDLEAHDHQQMHGAVSEWLREEDAQSLRDKLASDTVRDAVLSATTPRVGDEDDDDDGH